MGWFVWIGLWVEPITFAKGGRNNEYMTQDNQGIPKYTVEWLGWLGRWMVGVYHVLYEGGG